MWTALILFIALQPGVLVSLPKVGKGKTAFGTVLVHALLFYLIFSLRAYIPILNRVEGFQEKTVLPTKVKAEEVAAEVQPVRDANKTARQELRTQQKKELQDMQKRHQDERNALKITQTAELKKAIAREYKKKHPEVEIPNDASGNPILVD